MDDPSRAYVSLELSRYAASVNVSAVRLAQSILEGDFSHLEHDELDRLKASCTAPNPDPETTRSILIAAG